MKKFLSGLVLLLGVTLSSQSNAITQEDLKGYYLTPKFGYTLADINFKSKDTMNFGVSAGYDFQKKFDLPIRVDLEYLRHGMQHFKVKGKSVDFHVDSVLANVYYDLHSDFLAFTPYAVAGCGIAANGINRNPQFAVATGVGAYFPVNENFGLDLSTRYAYWGKVYNHHKTYVMQGLDTNIGIRYSF